MNFLNEDGSLKIVEWASLINGMDMIEDGPGNLLFVPSSRELDVRMAHSNATGKGLVGNGELGVDMIRLSAGDGFQPHTHPGDHLLIAIAGEGTIAYGGKVYPTKAGQVYMIEGSVPHAVGAITDHIILAVGSPHKPVDSDERMTPVEYASLAVEIGDVHCLICDVKATFPEALHDHLCPHCPCVECNPILEGAPEGGHHAR